MTRKPGIVWDDSHASNLRANVFKVAAAQGELALFFGETQKSRENESLVRITRRILINPLIAKKLSIALQYAVQQYESQYGYLDHEPREIDEPATLKTPLSLPDFQSKESVKRAQALYELISRRKLTVALERSFKLTERKSSPNRLLIAFKSNSLGTNPHETVAAIAAGIDMPDKFREAFNRHLAEATGIGLGLEEDGTKCILKAYLEFRNRYKEAIRKYPGSSDPFISHLGFKWDSEDKTKSALANYLCYPGFTLQQMLDRLSKTFYPEQGDETFRIVERLLERASEKASPGSLIYLEVTEQNNPRSSFDINLYGARCRLEEIYAQLLEIWSHFSISEEELHRFYEPLRTRTFGHLSGGRDRKGNNFITVYIGE